MALPESTRCVRVHYAADEKEALDRLPPRLLAIHEYVSTGSWSTGRLVHPHHAVTLVLQGGASVRMGRQRWELGRGGLSFYSPGTPYRGRARLPREPYRILSFRIDYGCDVAWPAQLPRQLEGEGRHVLSQLLARAGKPGAGGLEVKGFLLELMALALRGPSGASSKTPSVEIARLARANACLAEMLDRKFELGAFAKRLELSPSRAGHFYKAATGRSPREAHEALRLQEAARLLSSADVSITAVADRLGFAGIHHLSRKFKRTMGSSPRAWRAAGEPRAVSALPGPEAV